MTSHPTTQRLKASSWKTWRRNKLNSIAVKGNRNWKYKNRLRHRCVAFKPHLSKGVLKMLHHLDLLYFCLLLTTLCFVTITCGSFEEWFEPTESTFGETASMLTRRSSIHCSARQALKFLNIFSALINSEVAHFLWSKQNILVNFYNVNSPNFYLKLKWKGQNGYCLHW